MLTRLHISNFALLEDVELDLGSGLSCFTGETGAGKSILIDAICRLMGARTTQDDVRAGASKAVLEAVFDAASLGRAGGELLREWEIDCDDELILRRDILSSGKSRALINNCTVTVQQLRQLGSGLIDVFGQNEHQSLLDSESQRELYDSAIGVSGLVRDLSGKAFEIRILQKEWQALHEREQQRRRNIDMLQFQIKEIDGAKLGEQEEQELLSKKALMQNRERIHLLCESLLAVVLEKDDNLMGQADHVARDLSDLQRYDESLGEYSAKLLQWREDLLELTRRVDDLNRSLDFDDGSLDEVESRLDEIQKLKKKYGPTVADVLRHLETSRADLDRQLHAGERAEEAVLTARIRVREYRELAGRIGAARRAAKESFETKVETELKTVAMDRCRFRIGLREVVGGGVVAETAEESVLMQAEVPARGPESVEFEIEPNPGEGFRALHRIASGGELSRLMLGLKVVTQSGAGEGVLIFDEIDAGIGGRIAHRIGERLKKLSGGAQVLCVTHLPQVAAFGDSHFRVSKRSTEDRTTAIVERLEEPARVLELARMLSGSQITEAALQHARELAAEGRMKDAGSR
jgi:DNA repair protein RecN (Recombination protein N)